MNVSKAHFYSARQHLEKFLREMLSVCHYTHPSNVCLDVPVIDMSRFHHQMVCSEVVRRFSTELLSRFYTTAFTVNSIVNLPVSPNESSRRSGQSECFISVLTVYCHSLPCPTASTRRQLISQTTWPVC